MTRKFRLLPAAGQLSRWIRALGLLLIPGCFRSAWEPGLGWAKLGSAADRLRGWVQASWSGSGSGIVQQIFSRAGLFTQWWAGGVEVAGPAARHPVYPV